MNNIVFYLYYAMLGLVYATLVGGAIYVVLMFIKAVFLTVSGKMAVIEEAVEAQADRIRRIRRAKRRAKRREDAAIQRMIKEVRM